MAENIDINHNNEHGDETFISLGHDPVAVSPNTFDAIMSVKKEDQKKKPTSRMSITELISKVA